MKNARLFIRNDDVWTLDPSFRFFFDQAIERKLPIVYAVIPGKMEKELIQFLSRAKERNPQLLDIVQHGWMHLNHSKDSAVKYEFGESRSLKVQREDIQQGLKQMRLAFGKCFTSAFVPPFHGYDEQTLRILKEEGFGGFSAGQSKLKNTFGLSEFPGNISFSNYEKGEVSVKTAASVMELLIKGLYRGETPGVVMHHEDFSTDDSRSELTSFFDMVEKLRVRKGCRALLFSDSLEK